jgi:hypothetical protein
LVKVRRDAEFLYDFPEDQIEDDHDIVQFGGKGVTEAIARMIRGLGYQVSDPQDEDFKGWALNVSDRRSEFWLRFSDLRPTGILVTSDLTFPLWLWPWPRRAYVDFLSQLDAELRRDGRFREIKWFANYGSPTEVPSIRPAGD